MALFIQLFILTTAISLTQGFQHEDIKQALLQKLGLTEPPRIQKRDLENLVVPAHIKSKYLSMLKLHHQRRRRSLPSLAGIRRNQVLGHHPSASCVRHGGQTSGKHRSHDGRTEALPDRGSESVQAGAEAPQADKPRQSQHLLGGGAGKRLQ